MPELILASGSSYRRAQLAQAGIDVRCVTPGIDETALTDEAPEALAPRLARQKAAHVAAQFPNAIVIGADQVALCGDQVLGKPGSATAQHAQLRLSAGRELVFLTAVCILQASSARSFTHVDHTRCRMRALDEQALARYVELEPAYDSCGGFKVEGRGILLFESIVSEDPSALVGLPLIAVRRGLGELGVQLP